MVSSYLPSTFIHPSVTLNTIKTPPRTTSLKFRQIIMNSPSSALFSIFGGNFKQIHLDETTTDVGCSPRSTTSSLSSWSTKCSGGDLTPLENMPGDKRLPSFSAGNASIKYTKKLPKKKENRFYKHLFRWSSNSATFSTATSTAPKPLRAYDDGKQELMYRGIRVQKVPTTLDLMVIPLDVHFRPNSTLQRPVFARISY